MESKVILFDMDGTLADYDAAMLRDLSKLAANNSLAEMPYNIYDKDIPEWLEARMDLIKRQPGWWRNLKRYAPGFDILAMARLAGFTDIHILTKGPKSKPQAWAEKLEWCQEHLASWDVQVTITENKGLMYGRVLVDDYPPYAEAWLAHRPRGIVIMPTNKNNQTFTHPRVRHYRNEVDNRDTYEILLEAYNR